MLITLSIGHFLFTSNNFFHIKIGTFVALLKYLRRWKSFLVSQEKMRVSLLEQFINFIDLK